MKACPITKLPIENYNNGLFVSYTVNLNDKKIHFDFCRKCFYRIDFEKYRTVIFGLILNNKINTNGTIFHWDDGNNSGEINLKSIIEESIYPRTPKEKFDNLILQLYKERDSDGSVNLTILMDNYFSSKNYFNNDQECKIYLESLNRKGFINYNELIGGLGMGIRFPITFEGLDYIVQLEENGTESKNCFIAMAFDSRTLEIRNAIKNAILKTGFNPIIIDEQNVDSDRTINDAIIAGIKNSKFCIADFSLHRNGVYFESGFALGLGKPVIYCCSKEEFEKAHFDIKPLQHIIYESESELEKRLVDKIEAWIK